MLKNKLNVLVGRFTQLKHNVLRRRLWLAKYLFILMQIKLIFSWTIMRGILRHFATWKLSIQTTDTQSANLQNHKPV